MVRLRRRKDQQPREPRWHEAETVIMTQQQFRALRPSRHPLVMALWCCIGLVSVTQLWKGPSPTSVNSTLSILVQDALAGSIVIVAALQIIAACVVHSGISLGIEIMAMIFGASCFLVYVLAITDSQDQWWATAGFAWALGLFIGCTLRTVQIFRRGY